MKRLPLNLLAIMTKLPSSKERKEYLFVNET